MVRMPLLAAKIGRIHAFDLLRGYFLIVILLNHLYYYPSGLDILTGRGALYASTAEGFFVISGIVLGIVRGRKLIDKPFVLGAKLLLKRSLQLYLTSVILALIFTFIAWLFVGSPGLKVGALPANTPILEVIWKIASYQHLYGWADFLRQYAIFIAIAPLALLLLRRGWWYIVLALSWLTWTLFPHINGDGYMLQPISWQLIFFSGLVIGFHWPEIQGAWRRLSIKTRKWTGLGLVTISIITIIISGVLAHANLIGGEAGSVLASWNNWLGDWFNKDRLPVPRLILGAIWFWALFWLVRRYEGWLMQKTNWLLGSLGVNSLYVYTIQAFLVFFTHLFVTASQYGNQTLPWYLNLLISVGLIAVIWLAVRKQFLFKIIPR